jgi:hypothetical protein
LDVEMEINSAWETIRWNIKMSTKESLGYYELRKRKPRFNEGFSKLKAELQSLQDPSEINGDNLNNVRREASRHFRIKKREYLKDKIKELATNSDANKEVGLEKTWRKLSICCYLVTRMQVKIGT